MKKDCKINNLAPEMDAILVQVGEWVISVSRDENAKVYVIVDDTLEGSVTQLVLGEESMTQKV